MQFFNRMFGRGDKAKPTQEVPVDQNAASNAAQTQPEPEDAQQNGSANDEFQTCNDVCNAVDTAIQKLNDYHLEDEEVVQLTNQLLSIKRGVAGVTTNADLSMLYRSLCVVLLCSLRVYFDRESRLDQYAQIRAEEQIPDLETLFETIQGAIRSIADEDPAERQIAVLELQILDQKSQILEHRIRIVLNNETKKEREKQTGALIGVQPVDWDAIEMQRRCIQQLDNDIGLSKEVITLAKTLVMRMNDSIQDLHRQHTPEEMTKIRQSLEAFFEELPTPQSKVMFIEDTIAAKNQLNAWIDAANDMLKRALDKSGVVISPETQAFVDELKEREAARQAQKAQQPSAKGVQMHE